jgi:Fe-Mn family superoxide dismutase
MSIDTPVLPYSLDALAPHISAETLEYHYGKHHLAYAKKLNKLLPDSELRGCCLEDIVRSADGDLFNNAAQVWNHSFYWSCLSPQGGGAATGAIAAKLEEAFGSFDAFKNEFTSAAKRNFGSGWTWLVMDGDQKLIITNTANAQTPLSEPSLTALLTVDVWEHAYYIDHRNARGDYLKAFWKLVNWGFVNAQLNA